VRTVSLPSYAPNPYEDPGCQETHSPCERILRFFRGWHPGTVGLWQRLLTAFPAEEQTACACTKPVLRL